MKVLSCFSFKYLTLSLTFIWYELHQKACEIHSTTSAGFYFSKLSSVFFPSTLHMRYYKVVIIPITYRVVNEHEIPFFFYSGNFKLDYYFISSLPCLFVH